MNKNFSYYVKEFFQSYLPETRRLSKETIDTYRYCFIKIFYFFKQEKNIKPDDISLEMFNLELIEEFINWLSVKEKNKPVSINNRLATIKTFFKFVSTHNVEYLNLYSTIKGIDLLKTEEKIIEYLSHEEIDLLLSIPNCKNKKELKEFAILTLMYESAIRVSELCNLKAEDIEFSKINHVTIRNGKGGVSHKIPIHKEIGLLLQKYINTYKISPQDFLFKNRKEEKYTRWGITYILKKYINKGKEIDESKFKIKVTPHILRHSRAMHWLDAGIPITTIKKLLGHRYVKSTERYAKASPKQLEEAININSRSLKSKRRYNKKEKENLEEWLKNELNH